MDVKILKEIYSKIFLIRKVEDIIIENYKDNEMKTPMHMSRGAEAIASCICYVLRDKGQYFTTYRSHAVYLASGGNLKKFMAEMYGKENGRYGGKSGSMHIASPETGHISSSAIVASNISVAIGAAWVNRIKDNNRIVVTFFGDGALDEGTFWESINIASLWRLPILFVLEDNRLAVHTPSSKRQGYNNIIRIIKEFNIETDFCIGSDAQSIWKSINKIIENTSFFSKRPGFLRASYYRYLEHVGINSDIKEKYRKNDIWKANQFNDPVFYNKNRLLKKHIDVSEIEKNISEEVEKALEFAKKDIFSDSEKLYQDVLYA